MNCFCVHDDGTGYAIYVAGSLRSAKGVTEEFGVWRRIAWKWQPVGPRNQNDKLYLGIQSLTSVHYQGTSWLIGCGWFGSGAGDSHDVARWDGKQWAAPGWFPSKTNNPDVLGPHVIVSYQDALYLAGSFQRIGDLPAVRIARIGRGSNSPEAKNESAPKVITTEPSATLPIKRKYRVVKVAPAGQDQVLAARFAALSNTGQVAAANKTKIPVPLDVAAPLFDDNPFTPPRRGLPRDPHLVRERILLWDEKDQSLRTLPGPEPKYAWRTVCVSPNSSHVVATEYRTLGSKSSYRWSGQRWQPIPQQISHDLVIYAVNDSGLMVGAMDSGDRTNSKQAVAIVNGRPQVLSSPAQYATAWSVSNSGFIAGHALDKFGTVQACIWKDNQPKLLGTLGGKSSTALSVNDAGTAVGVSARPTIKKPRSFGRTAKCGHSWTIKARTPTLTASTTRGSLSAASIVPRDTVSSPLAIRSRT